MKSTPLLLLVSCCLFGLVFASCAGDPDSDSTNKESNDLIEPVYKSFSNFPQQQFKSINLGAPFNQIENEVVKMPIQIIAEEEDAYFYFPSDSTELILPSAPQLNEFKVFLRSGIYLNDIPKFHDFLSNSALKVATDDLFTVYLYETEKVDFKLTLFQQPNSLRLHFILMKSRA